MYKFMEIRSSTRSYFCDSRTSRRKEGKSESVWVKERVRVPTSNSVIERVRSRETDKQKEREREGNCASELDTVQFVRAG